MEEEKELELDGISVVNIPHLCERKSLQKNLFFFVCFISTNYYKNKAIQRNGVKANVAMALQPVKTPGSVCQ